MMRKADRLFQLVNLIRVHHPVTAAQLAARLEVSVRTIYRYIDDISASGIPVYGEAGRGYTLSEGFELPPLTLSDDELEALTLSVDMLSRAAGLELSCAARSLLAKINAVVPAAKRPAVTPQLQSLASGLAPEQMRHWDRLRRAIRQGEALQLDYLSLSGEHSQRTVWPLGLFYWGGKWTLGTWCYLRQDYRDFRVDTIQRLEPAANVAPPAAEINLDHYTRQRCADWEYTAEHHLPEPLKATDTTLSAAPLHNGHS